MIRVTRSYKHMFSITAWPTKPTKAKLHLVHPCVGEGTLNSVSVSHDQDGCKTHA